MKKIKLAIVGFIVALSSVSFAAPAADQPVITLQNGAYKYLGDARASFDQGFFMGTVLARAYDSKACIPGGTSNKEVLTAVASSMMKSLDLEKLGNMNAIADASILAAFPCK